MIALFDGSYGEDEAHAREVERDIERARLAEQAAREAGEEYYADYWKDEIKRLEATR